MERVFKITLLDGYYLNDCHVKFDDSNNENESRSEDMCMCQTSVLLSALRVEGPVPKIRIEIVF